MAESALYHTQDAPQIYIGTPSEKMPLIINNLHFPANVAYIVIRQLDLSLPEYREHKWYTGDGILIPKKEINPSNNRRFKLCTNSPRLRMLHSESQHYNGGLAIDSYEQIEAPEFIEGQNGVILSRGLTSDEAKNHPVWLAFFGGKQRLLDEVVDRTSYELRRFVNCNRMMKITLPHECRVSREWLACVSWQRGSSKLSGLAIEKYGRTIGLPQEALLPTALERLLNNIGLQREMTFL